MFELLSNDNDASGEKERKKEARQALIRSIFDEVGYKATVDFPSCMFADDLRGMYPDAKV